MSQKSRPDPGDSVVVVVDAKTMKKVIKLAAKYGIEPEAVILELMRMEASERPEGATLH